MLNSFIENNRKKALEVGFTSEQYEKLVNRYGSNIHQIFHIVENYDSKNEYALPLEVYAELVYGICDEMTVKPVDFFIRRTGALLFDIAWVHKWKQPVLEYMADRLKWTEEEKENYRKELELQLRDATQPTGEA